MSLIDVILGQKIIPLTIGLAVLLIMLAVVLMIVPRIRKHRAKVAQERAERIAAAEAEQIDDEPEPIQARTSPKKPSASTPSAAAAAPAAKPAAASVLTAASPQTAGQPQASETVPSDMQDILSSVFSDEDNSERQAALMRGMSDVDMNDLLTLTQQVVVQLHGGKTVTVVSDKELQ